MSTKRLTVAAFFMALVIILSSSVLSIPVPGGHFYFNGIVICLVGLIFPPTEAVIVAGIGSFLGDFFFYPAPMFVTLVTHSLQVLVISALVVNKSTSKRKVITALTLGGLIDIIGYYLGRSFVYANMEYAVLKLPFDIIAVIIGAVVAYLIYYHTGFLQQFQKAISEK